MWKNDAQGFGWIAIIMHWVMAVLITGLFAMGLWMRELAYYDSWYHRAPALHKEIGILLLLLLLFRMVWRILDPPPQPVPTLKRWERVASVMVHRALYFLTLLTIVSGYFIATAAQAGVAWFGLVEIPAFFPPIENQEDIAGEAHEIFAWVILVTAGGHAAAALKHHFLDRDATLLRMLGLGRGSNDAQ